MRLLTQLLPPERAIPSRRGRYLRDRLHGTERDPFALELARLSLTLTDIPNPDGWDLRVEDMFLGDRLAEQTRGKTILLANPPFEKFTAQEMAAYVKADTQIIINNKAAEMLRRTLPELQPGSVFGVVVPQSLLHGTFAEDVRRYLIEQFELREVSLFPDKVFSFSDAESAVLLGRRLPEHSSSRTTLRFRRIRESQLSRFRKTYDAPNSRTIEQSRFNAKGRWDMRVPDLEEVWLALADNPKAADLAEIANGLDYHGKDLPTGVRTYSEVQFPGAYQGFVRLERGMRIHQLPKLYWMNLDEDAIQERRSGATVGVPQVLMNYARVSRGLWRLKALIDPIGRPVTSAFLTVRPHVCSLESLWALLNSPVANAYAFCHLGKRHNILSDMRRIPMPGGAAFDEIATASREYLNAAAAGADSDELYRLMLKVDAAVLLAYDLPPRLERQLLDLFTGVERKGVGCDFRGYYPPGFTSYLPLHIIISDRFQRAAADATADRFLLGESAYVRDVLTAAAELRGEE